MRLLLFCLISAVSLLYYPLSYEQFDLPKALALTTFGCIAFFTVRWKNHYKDPMALALFTFVVSAALSTAFSIDKHISFYGNVKSPMGLIVITSLWLVYLVSKEAMGSLKSIHSIIDTILICGGIIALYAICQTYGIDFQTWSRTLKESTYTRPLSTQGHPNFMANYLAMVLPFGLYRLELVRSWNKKILLALICSIFVASIFASLSRGMIIAALTGCLAYVLLSKKNIKEITALSTICAAISLTVLISLPGFKKDALHRMDAFLSPGIARPQYPLGAIRVWRKYPWFGSGTDTFELAFRNARTPYYWHAEPGGSPHRAHQDFLNILATQGILGAMSAILLTLTIVRFALLANTRLGFAAISSITAFYVAGLTSFVIISTGTLFMISIAILKSKHSRIDVT